MYSPYTPTPEILNSAVRPVDCFRDGFELIKDQYWLFLGIVLVAGVLGGLTCGVLIPTMTCGVALCFMAKARRQFVQFDLLFKGFEFFVPSLLIMVVWLALYLLTSAPNIVLAIMSNPLVNKSIPPSGDMTLTLIGYAVSLLTSFIQQILQMVMFFACVFLVDRRLTALEAIKSAMTLFASNIAQIIALGLLGTLANIVGMLACCIGVFFVLPIVQSAIAVAYLQAVPSAQGPAPDFASPPAPDPFRPPYA